MERVFEYEIPVLHPVVVHFPIVLLLVTAALVLLWAVTDKEAILRFATALSAMASVGAFWARQTGEIMKEQSAGTPIVETLVSFHEQAAEWTLWSAGVLTAMLLMANFGDRLWALRAGTPRWTRMACGALALVAVGLALWTGHIGGIMVWGVAR